MTTDPTAARTEPGHARVHTSRPGTPTPLAPQVGRAALAALLVGLALVAATALLPDPHPRLTGDGTGVGTGGGTVVVPALDGERSGT